MRHSHRTMHGTALCASSYSTVRHRCSTAARRGMPSHVVTCGHVWSRVVLRYGATGNLLLIVMIVIYSGANDKVARSIASQQQQQQQQHSSYATRCDATRRDAMRCDAMLRYATLRPAR